MHRTTTYQETQFPLVEIDTAAEFISSVQKRDGEIPWSKGGKTDPWDHVESAMGLTIGGYLKEAKKAYQWSAGTQMEDGSWWAHYEGGVPDPKTYKDTNMTAYIAVGVLHYYLATGDLDFLATLWPTVERAMDYVLILQGDEGQMHWAKRKDGSIDENALLTGSSSIYMSLTCALRLAFILGRARPQWEVARMRLGKAIKYKPHLFDVSKSRFSMDWYYPVLCGAITGEKARQVIKRGWERFTVADWGVLCVCDEPWVTMAETSELSLALAAMGEYEAAEIVLGWTFDKRYEDGSYWTGVTVPDGVIYTTEKTTWTAAAVLLAADILYDLTRASKLFGHSYQKTVPLV